jgi:hypothetical protein
VLVVEVVVVAMMDELEDGVPPCPTGQVGVAHREECQTTHYCSMVYAALLVLIVAAAHLVDGGRVSG